MEYCMVCERIEQIKAGKNPYFVKELNTGYVVIGDHQRLKGYSLFLCKKHAMELHFLEPDFRDEFLHEMAVVAEAVYNAFKPDKLNYGFWARAMAPICTGTFFRGGKEILKQQDLFGN